MKVKDQQPPANLSPVFARGAAATPRVRAGDSPWTVWAGVVGAGVLGVMVFNGLSSGRDARAQPAATPVAKTLPPPAAPPPATPAPAPPAPVANPGPPVQSSVGAPPNPSEAHWRAPAMVVDFSTATDAQAAQAAQAGGLVPLAGAAVQAATDARQSADERFAARITGGSGDTARATQMYDLGRVIPQGATLAATLETAINSDLPGSVRAVISRDVRSFDGSRVLIPRGSKLIGQYRSAAAVGQTRAFVVWSRIITPTGISIDVGSPATDRLGRGGLDGEVDTHFFRRFGASILLSVVTAGTQALANNSSNNTTLVIGSPTQANRVAEIALQKQIEMPDTIKVPQGVPVQVFVARDLDFAGVVR